MECSNMLEAAIKKGDVSKLLFTGSREKELITDLQRVLFELGFRKELNWDNYEADGDYGKSTTAAVAAFAKKNKYASDGTKVTNDLAKLILQRHDFLPSMYILWTIWLSDFRTKKYISKGTRTSITAIQTLLNEMGFGKMMNFEKYGADGIYGTGTKTAFIAFAKDRGVQSDGDLLTKELTKLILDSINPFYGANWMDQAVKMMGGGGGGGTKVLVLYEGSRFRGKPVQCDVLFLPALEKINAYAEKAGVYIFVTSSFRTTTNVKGAIVKPATYSNHLAGHGIDMNVIYGPESTVANSVVLGKYPSCPEPVRIFIKSIIDDPGLRWGGQFNTKDPVHIDDGLNGDMKKWSERYEAMQRAVQLA